MFSFGILRRRTPAVLAQCQRTYASKGLFVGNLAWRTGEKELEECFASVGQVVRARVISDRMTGRSRGFGFVDFADEATASKALQELDGKDLLGRALRLREATGVQAAPRENNNYGSPYERRGGYNSNENNVRGMAGQHTTSFANESYPNPLKNETDLSARSRASEQHTAQAGNETL